MNQLFRCPSCKEVIRTDQPVCQYCDSSIDGPTAHAESLKFQAGIDACAAANHIKSLNYAAPFLLLMDAALLLPGMGDEFFSSPKLKDNLECIGGLCAVGLTFIIVSALMIGDLTERGKSKVDGRIPGVFPVVVRVEDKAQIVWGDDLNQYLEEHPNYSLLIPENQTEKFQSQINSNIRGAQSPPNFDTRSDLPWDAFFTVRTIAPGKQAFKVYATWDDDRMNVGWYEATDKEISLNITHYTLVPAWLSRMFRSPQ